MALASIDDALAQYNANLPWYTSVAKAQAALEAVQYLLVNRAQRLANQGSDLNFESLAAEKADLVKFLGASAPRSFGRSRVNVARFCGRSSIQ